MGWKCSNGPGPHPYARTVAEPSPIGRASLKCENEYIVLALGEGTADQVMIGFIIRAFRRLKKPRSLEMRARGYALHSVCPQLSFFFSYSTVRNKIATDSWQDGVSASHTVYRWGSLP